MGLYNRNRLNTFFLLLLIFSLRVFSVEAQDIRNPGYSEEIDSARRKIEQWMEQHQIPGVQLSLMKDGEIIWSEGFGYANVEHRVPLTPRTKMRIGSVSKTLTSAALGLLIEEGLLDVDQPVQVYVPYFPEKKYPITTRQVAGHIAGIRHYRGDEFLMNRFFPTVKEGITIFAYDTLLFEPGSKYTYSSYGYNLISAVVEGASGEDFLIYMQERVFDPLEMKETIADFNEQIIPYRTAYYAVKDSTLINAPYVDNSYKWAGGGFLSTTEDLVKFGNAFLNEGYLKSTSIEELWKSQKISNGKETGYGMGWRSGENENFGKWYGHSGGSVGGTTQFIIYPEQRLILAMMANLSSAQYKNLHQQLAALFLNKGSDN